MREMRDALLAIAGCIGVEPPFLTEAEGAECLVGISKWESEEAFALRSSWARRTKSWRARFAHGSASSWNRWTNTCSGVAWASVPE
jgi:hypothetical protein